MKDTNVYLFGIEISGKITLLLIIFLFALFSAFLIHQLVYKRNRKRAYITLALVFSGCFGVINGSGFIFNHLQKHQQNRIEITLGLREDPKGDGYNVHQAMAAIGSGKMSGKGYLHGTLSNTKYKHVPMQSTDFIFCSVGEEWGFIGSVTVVILFVILLLRIIFIAERQRSSFTRIYAYSVASILFMHFMINIGMAIGIAPVIGIPLPFFSYGGSSLLGFSILIFILIRLDADRKEVLR